MRGLYTALNERDFASAAGAVAEHCDWEGVAAETAHRGSGPIVDGLRQFAEAFPDFNVEITKVVADGGTVVVEWRATGTFAGPFLGTEPNGKAFSRRGCSVAEVEGAKIVRYRDYYDRATMLRQLDLLHLL